MPFTAGLINSSSFFGYLKGTGDAVWTTKSAPSIAKNNESLFPKSASTNSSWLKSLPNAYLKGSIFYAFLVSLTVPFTVNEPSFKKKKATWEPKKPETPVMRTTGLDFSTINI